VQSVSDVFAEVPVESGVFAVSGGEPLLQAGFAAELLRTARRHGLRTVLETSGHGPWLDFARVLPFADLVLYDLKHVDPYIHRRLTGVRNDLILANLERVVASGNRVALRMPLVPGCNADGATVLAVARLARDLGIPDLHLVPYHRHGEWKYLALGRGYPLDGAVPLSDEVVNELAQIAEQVGGLRVRVGG
jgi:pyruvate formate lyase activating enzyme